MYKSYMKNALYLVAEAKLRLDDPVVGQTLFLAHYLLM